MTRKERFSSRRVRNPKPNLARICTVQEPAVKLPFFSLAKEEQQHACFLAYLEDFHRTECVLSLCALSYALFPAREEHSSQANNIRLGRASSSAGARLKKLPLNIARESIDELIEAPFVRFWILCAIEIQFGSFSGCSRDRSLVDASCRTTRARAGKPVASCEFAASSRTTGKMENVLRDSAGG